MIKGQKYISEAADQCQQEKLSSYYKSQVLETINLYKTQLMAMKQHYPDTDRAVIDQSLLQLDAVSAQVGGK